jgi:hypothetical protein
VVEAEGVVEAEVEAEAEAEAEAGVEAEAEASITRVCTLPCLYLAKSFTGPRFGLEPERAEPRN